MPMRRTSHAVYDTQYHLVWAPKYRKWILHGPLRDYAREVFYRIAEEVDFAIEELELAQDHVHVFLSFCKALGFLDTYLVFSPPPQRTGFVVCLGGPAPVFYSRAAARSTVHCRRA